MAATTGGTLKAYIESLGLNIGVHRDRVPTGQALPYIRVTEDIATVPDGHTPPYDNSGTPGVTEHVQIDLFQTWKKDDNSQGESYTLADTLFGKLHGLRGTALATIAPKRVWGILVSHRMRVPHLEENYIQHIYQLEIKRDA